MTSHNFDHSLPEASLTQSDCDAFYHTIVKCVFFWTDGEGPVK
jgi:hypothetical protein